MRRLLISLAMLAATTFAGCELLVGGQGAPDAAIDADGGPPGAADAGPDAGSLAVHVASAPSDLIVFLGDGSHFVATPDTTGTARFSAPGLSGPETVSLVYKSNSATTDVVTFVGFSGSEMYVDSSYLTLPKIAGTTISGTVRGGSGGSVSVSLAGSAVSGDQFFANADGSYARQLQYTSPGGSAVSFIAAEWSQGRTLQIGALRNVSIASTGLMPDITLTHPMDSPVSAFVENSDPYSNPWAGAMVAFDSIEATVQSAGGGTQPFTVWIPSSTAAPFDGARWSLVGGGGDEFQGGHGEARAPLSPGAATGSVRLLSPAALVAPALGRDINSPPALSRSPLRFQRGDLDPEADYWSLWLSSGTSPALHWYVLLPAPVTEFQIFMLPREAGSTIQLPAGTLTATMTSIKSGGGPAFLWMRESGTPPPVFSAWTRWTGFGTLP